MKTRNTNGKRKAENGKRKAQFSPFTFPLSLFTLTLFSVLCTLYSCTSESEPVAPSHAPITLTTPRIELGEVTADALSRAVVGTDGSAVKYSIFELYMLDADGNQQGETATYSYSTEGTWKANKAPVVQNGAGQYYAGITGHFSFAATETMPFISSAKYSYRGYITVTEDGTFTPGAALSPMTAAVQVKLKDANGAEITGDNYSCSYEGLYKFNGYLTGTDGKVFPMGKADPVISCFVSNDLYSFSLNMGNYVPGTYPAELVDVDDYGCGKMVSATAAPTAPWTLFTIHYCPDGFEYNDDFEYTPQGEHFTWVVNYSGTLTLEAGKLYTFTITLGSDRVITLGPDAVTLSEWTEGETINVGKTEN